MIKLFHDNLDFFREAVLYTSRKTGFNEALIEKDYYCSLILLEIFKNKNTKLVFKGGTLLNKAYAGFYRLSEDLDFTLPTPLNSTRGQRSSSIKPYKESFKALEGSINNIQILIDLTGSNNSLQYNGELIYKSCFKGISGRILFEIGLREETLEKPIYNNLKTLITDPYSEKPILEDVSAKCLTLKEAYAEKLRATLTRKKLAVRDIYDMHHAVENKIIDIYDESFITLAVQKISSQKTLLIPQSKDLQTEMLKFLDLQLKPVLRSNDYDKFDFTKAWALLLKLKELIEPKLI